MAQRTKWESKTNKGNVRGLSVAEKTFLLLQLLDLLLVAGVGFVMTSTAIVMQLLEERGDLSAPKGQRMVSILLFEDIMIVPIIFLLGAMAPNAADSGWEGLAETLGIGIAVVKRGALAVRPRGSVSRLAGIMRPVRGCVWTAAREVRPNRPEFSFLTGWDAAMVPMLVMGDELSRTQQGNNNAYCQDNESSWLDWEGADHELLDYSRKLINFVYRHPTFCRRRWFQGQPINGIGLEDIAWFLPEGSEMTEEHWNNDFAKSLGLDSMDKLREILRDQQEQEPSHGAGTVAALVGRRSTGSGQLECNAPAFW